MSKTTRRQKAFLIILGIFTSLIVVECSLRGAGLIYSFLQEKENKSSQLTDTDEIRILCIGDSMTALGRRNSYPAQLEDILNVKKSDKKYVVLNKGIVGKDSEGLTMILDNLLRKHDPHIVIAMVGINDRANHYHPMIVKIERFLNNFRTFNLATWLWHGIQVKVHRNNESRALNQRDFEIEGADLDNEQLVKGMFVNMQRQIDQMNSYLAGKNDQTKNQVKEEIAIIKRNQLELLIAVALYHRTRHDFPKAIGYLQSAIELDKDNYLAYVEMGRSLEEMGKYEQAITFLHRANKIGPVTYLTNFELAKCYEKMGNLEEAESYYSRVYEISRITKKENISGDMGNWFVRNKDYQRAEEALLKALKERPDDYHLYEQMAALYRMGGNEDEAGAVKYLERGYKLRQMAESFLPETVHNYNKIAEIVMGHDRQLIVMQYPLRRLKPLKDIFWNAEEILFVDNEASFFDTLKVGEFQEYFNDFFAGDFGHCTGKGNRLIAANALKAIEEALSRQ